MAAVSQSGAARASAETERRQPLTENICPSETSSMFDVETLVGERTPRARSPASARTIARSSSQSTAVDHSTQSYKGFPSRAHYLAALNEWADSKRYLDPGESTLTGYYGTTTVSELASRPRIEFGFSNWKQQRKEKREARKRSAT